MVTDFSVSVLTRTHCAGDGSIGACERAAVGPRGRRKHHELTGLPAAASGIQAAIASVRSGCRCAQEVTPASTLMRRSDRLCGLRDGYEEDPTFCRLVKP